MIPQDYKCSCLCEKFSGEFLFVPVEYWFVQFISVALSSGEVKARSKQRRVDTTHLCRIHGEDRMSNVTEVATASAGSSSCLVAQLDKTVTGSFKNMQLLE